MVCSNSWRAGEVCHSSFDKIKGYCLHNNVHVWYCYWPSCEMVYTCQEEEVPIWITSRSYHIKMNTVETSVGSFERAQATYVVSNHLRFPTAYTGARSLPHIIICTRSTKSFRGELAGCSDTWMRKLMQHSEGFLSIMLRYDWTIFYLMKSIWSVVSGLSKVTCAEDWCPLFEARRV